MIWPLLLVGAVAAAIASKPKPKPKSTPQGRYHYAATWRFDKRIPVQYRTPRVLMSLIPAEYRNKWEASIESVDYLPRESGDEVVLHYSQGIPNHRSKAGDQVAMKGGVFRLLGLAFKGRQEVGR